MKKTILVFAITMCGFGMKAQNETVNGQLTINGNLKQNINGTPSTWFYLIKSSNKNSGFWANNGNPALYLRDNNGNLNTVVRPDGKSYFNGGNVGIGTTNPSGLLDIFSIKPTDHWITRMNTNGSNWSGFWETSDNIRLLLRDDQGNIDVNLRPNGMSYINGGNLGIGTTNPDEKLTVKGKIHAEEVRVDLAVPADYVFQHYYNGSSTLKEDYTIPTLEEVAAFTKKNKHLPAIPSAKEIQKEGLHLKEMTNLLLQKIEELTIYTIEQEKRIKTLEATLLEKKH